MAVHNSPGNKLPPSRFADPWEVADRAADACRTVAPLDLAAAAIYVIPYSLVAATHPELCGPVGGWTGLALDMSLRPLLKSYGRWRGRGFACVVSDWWTSEAAFIGTALHELAHWLDYGPMLLNACAEDDAADLAVEFLGLALPREASLLLSAAVEGATGGAPPLRCRVPRKRTDPARLAAHQDRFNRVAVHLRHRALQTLAGFEPDTLRFAGDSYGQSPPAAYVEALASECQARQGEPLAAILASQPPASFAELWRLDNEPTRLAAWEAEQSAQEADQATLLASLGELLARAETAAEQEALLRAAFAVEQPPPREGGNVGTTPQCRCTDVGPPDGGGEGRPVRIAHFGGRSTTY